MVVSYHKVGSTMMKIKKRLLTGLLAGLAALTLAGCANQGKQIAQQQQGHQTTQQAQQNANDSSKPSFGAALPTKTYPNQNLAQTTLTPSVKAQLGADEYDYNGAGAFNLYGGHMQKLNVNVSSAPYVQQAKRNPSHGNRVEGTARAWLNHSSRQYQNRNAMGQGRGSFKPVGFRQIMGLNAKAVGYNHLYDRGHLIAYAIAGNVRGFDASESNADNIVTQTAWSNEAGTYQDGTGQNYYEAQVRKALDQNQQVMYAVTPIYNTPQDLVPMGMHLQAKQKDGTVLFNVFVPNVENGFKINYQTGKAVVNNNKAFFNQ